MCTIASVGRYCYQCSNSCNAGGIVVAPPCRVHDTLARFLEGGNKLIVYEHDHRRYDVASWA